MTAVAALDQDDDTPEARAKRTRAYLRKGSAAPVAGRCGSQLAGPGATEAHRTLEPGTPWRYCLQYPAKGKERCKLHGALSLAGTQHPNFKHGLYSLAFKGTPLLAGYEAFATDAELLSCREQIRLLNARSSQLATRAAAATGESGAAWRRAGEAVRAMSAAFLTGDSDAATAAIKELEAVVLRQAAAERDWAEERAIAEVHRRLVDTQHRLLERGRHVVPVDQVVQHNAQIAAVAVRHILAGRDTPASRAAGRRALSEYQGDLRALAEGITLGDSANEGGK